MRQQREEFSNLINVSLTPNASQIIHGGQESHLTFSRDQGLQIFRWDLECHQNLEWGNKTSCVAIFVTKLVTWGHSVGIDLDIQGQVGQHILFLVIELYPRWITVGKIWVKHSVIRCGKYIGSGYIERLFQRAVVQVVQPLAQLSQRLILHRSSHRCNPLNSLDDDSHKILTYN